ncbi:YcfA-like protein [Rodentibacter pneumotropicus]|uniref:YcfA-like protein n=1 Tax=Rodentibacter pneumotropicus TaxID=758 RepID=A0A3S4XTN2_9PAST|nr:YcfA-like protein [Rodentibacter pneumotropicus]
MGSGYYDRLIVILRENGCHFLRQGKGSHENWYSPITNKAFTVAYTINSRILANKILKQAGIDFKF